MENSSTVKQIVMLILGVFCFSCSDNDAVENSRCDLEPDQGLCNASFSKYYFDKDEGKCKEFVWGGCGGVVPFDTLEECLECKKQFP